MDELRESYKIIKDRLLSLNISEAKIYKMVIKVEKHLNSPRTCALIEDMAGLMGELEKRELTSPQNINLLLDIVPILNDRKLIDLINQHIQLLYRWNQQPDLQEIPSYPPDAVISGVIEFSPSGQFGSYQRG
jgi:hypothetical protein